MNREISFRGKRIDNGEWAYGLVWKKKYNSDRICISYFPNEDDEEAVVRVLPETICQYTGLTDKNGRKIFEGDIITYEKRKFHVVWVGNIASFVSKPLEDVRICPCMNIGTMKASEVIGNVLNNPELLNQS